MGFIALLKTLDDLVYEIMSWLIFYPITLWRTVRHPLRMMTYADRELDDAAEEQFTDTLSPPLFLLLTLLLAHAAELAVVGQNAIVASNKGLAALVRDDTSLILLRLLIFSTFPMMLAARLVRAKGIGVTRKSLQSPFYGQCYAAAPFALLLAAASLLMHVDRVESDLIGGAMILIALLAYAIVQMRWFHFQLGGSWWRAAGQTARALAQGLLLIALVLPLFV